MKSYQPLAGYNVVGEPFATYTSVHQGKLYEKYLFAISRKIVESQTGDQQLNYFLQ